MGDALLNICSAFTGEINQVEPCFNSFIFSNSQAHVKKSHLSDKWHLINVILV